MRRAVFLGALVAILALVSAPVSAQTSTTPTLGQPQAWRVNATVGPSFGTLGTAPAALAAASYEMGNGVSITGEAGTFRGKPILRDIPAISGPDVDPDDRVNAFHYNVNLTYEVPERAGFSPYVTAGVGAFNTSMVDTPVPGAGPFATYDRFTRAATNVGGGLGYRINRWLGVRADYRLFSLADNDGEHLSRFTTGVSLHLP